MFLTAIAVDVQITLQLPHNIKYFGLEWRFSTLKSTHKNHNQYTPIWLSVICPPHYNIYPQYSYIRLWPCQFRNFRRKITSSAPAHSSYIIYEFLFHAYWSRNSLSKPMHGDDTGLGGPSRLHLAWISVFSFFSVFQWFWCR